MSGGDMGETLERFAVTVPPAAVPAFEAALAEHCLATGSFHDEDRGVWVVEGFREAGDDSGLDLALGLAGLATGVSPELVRETVPAGGWLARSYQGFPEQTIGTRFAVRGTHIVEPEAPGRITITLDAGLAFGSGEHESTRGCLLALEDLAKSRRPLRILDLGTGSGVLAIAATRVFGRAVFATDIDARAVRVTRENAAQNGVARRVRVWRADGWDDPGLARHAPYDLVLANILARPLSAMAHRLAARLAPDGIVVLAGLLATQERMVLVAHRRHGLVLRRRIRCGKWTTLELARPDDAA